MTGAMGTRKSFRVHVGRIDADIVAAAARCADAFVVTGTPHARLQSSRVSGVRVSPIVLTSRSRGIRNPRARLRLDSSARVDG